MTRLRKHVKDNYTVIDNALLSDESLSFRARGVAAFLLSKPDDWLIKLDYLAKLGSEGKAAIRTAMQELATVGYLMRERIRRPDGTLSTVTHLANYPAFIEIGTPSTRAMGYEPKCQESDIPETDTSDNRSSETEEVLPSTEEPSTENQLVGGGPTNQPTNGAEAPKPQPQPNGINRENASFDLLSEMGVTDTVARKLIQLRSFEQIRRQVFGWLKERKSGNVEVGLLVYRIRKDSPCADPDPDPEIDRALWDRYRTAAELEAEAEAQRELAEMLERPPSRPKAKPRPRAQPLPTYDDPWAIVVAELSASGQLPDGILERAQAEPIGEKDEAQVWQISLDMQDAPEFTWMQRQGAVLIRKTLKSILGRAVLVDVVIPATEPEAEPA